MKPRSSCVWKALCIALIPSGVAAQVANPTPNTAVDSVVQDADAAAQKLRITMKDCRRLVRHTASADVAYKPGVDVRGNPVTPADASGGFTIPLPDVFEFTITKDLAGYLGKGDDQLAADEAASIAADRNQTATAAAVSSAELSLAGAQSVYDTANAALTAAETAAAASPSDDTLAAAVVTAQSAVDSAATGLADTQSAFDATSAAASSNDVSTALSSSQEALSAAQSIGYAQDTTASTASSTAISTASEYQTAYTSAQAAAETVAKSSTMTLNIGTVRYNINTGAMTFNGEPLTDPAEAALAEQCRHMMAK